MRTTSFVQNDRWRKWHAAPAAMVVVLTMICAQGATAQESGMRQAEGVAAGQDLDRQFVRESMRTNLLEVAVGKDVAERAKDPQVRQFAQTMADFHSKANERLRQTAHQMNLETPDSMNEWQQAMAEHMKELKPGELDQEYMFHQAGTHHIKLLNHRLASNQASEPEVKQLAKQMIPDLQSHMEKADRIATEISKGGQNSGTGQG